MTKQVATLLMAAALVFSGCAKKQQIKPDDGSLLTAADADENAAGDSDSGKAMGLETIHFGYDTFTLESEAKAVLKANAQILKDKASMKIQVEGHCDQRGGIQYNIALGEKRANAVKKFLTDLGIKKERISTISFGKEKLLDAGESEEAYAKNRRATFVIAN